MHSIVTSLSCHCGQATMGIVFQAYLVFEVTKDLQSLEDDFHFIEQIMLISWVYITTCITLKLYLPCGFHLFQKYYLGKMFLFLLFPQN